MAIKSSHCLWQGELKRTKFKNLLICEKLEENKNPDNLHTDTCTNIQ
jgi:hypothetical protein